MCGIGRPLMNRDALEWVIKRLKEVEEEPLVSVAGEDGLYSRLSEFIKELESNREDIRA